MHKFCLDTSWISSPIIDMPPDVHVTLWSRISSLIDAGAFCWNTEIWQEMHGSIYGEIGEKLKEHNKSSCYEIGSDDWDWIQYLYHVENIRNGYKKYISEYNGNRKGTVSLNDCSIVCLAKTLKLPVASMEKPNRQPSLIRIRIPELCERENVEHVDLNELLRKEGLTA